MPSYHVPFAAVPQAVVFGNAATPAAAADTAGSAAISSQTQAAIAEQLEVLSGLCRQIAAQLEREHQQQRRDRTSLWTAAVELATAAAAQLMTDHIEEDRGRLEAIIAAAIDQLPEPADTAYLNPLDLQQLQQHTDGASSLWEPQLRLTPDASLPRGVCRVEGPRHGIVHHWGYQLAEIRQSMLDRIHAG